MASQERVGVILSSPSDWEEWIEVIRSSASKAGGVWRFIDPDDPNPPKLTPPERKIPQFVRDQATRGRGFAQPTQPASRTGGAATTRSQSTAPAPTASSEERVQPSAFTTYSSLDDFQKEELRTIQDDYQFERRRWEKQEAVIDEIRDKIQETIRREYLPYIKGGLSAHKMLVQLKTQLAPTSRGMIEEWRSDWRKLQKLPKSSDLKAWTIKWDTLYFKGCTLKAPEVSGNTPIIDFLNVIGSTYREFTTIWDGKMLDEDATYELTQVTKQFLAYLRNTTGRQKPRGQHGVFAISEVANAQQKSQPTLQGRTKDKKSKDTSDNQNKAQTKKCLCEELHRYKECPYILKSNRTKGWKPNKEVEEQVQKRIKGAKHLQKLIQRIRQEAGEENSWDYTKDRTTTDDKFDHSSQDEEEPASFFTYQVLNDSCQQRTMSTTSSNEIYASFPAFEVSSEVARSSYSLCNSVILDSGATVHVCNDRTRFTDFAPAKPNDMLFSGDQQLSIEGFGTVVVIVNTPQGVRRINLLQTALVPTFHTSVASLRKFRLKGVHWNTEIDALTHEGKPYIYTPMKFGQWVLEYNDTGPEEIIDTAFLTSYDRKPPQRASKQVWHERLGHLSQKALNQLPFKTDGAEFTTTTYDTACEVCRQSNATKIISRRSTPRSQTPYEKVHLDLIQNKTTSDGSTYVLHFLDDMTRMHHVYILQNKRQETVLQTIKDFVTYVRRRWGFIIRIFKLDGESALAKEWEDWIKDEGYEVQPSPPHTPEQNGPIERSGRTVIRRARSLRISSNLPYDLWPEMFKTAGYLINRSPSSTLNWETPYGRLLEYVLQENLKGSKPIVSHLKIYGCRAYPLIQKYPKLERLNSRAHIGYLVGYDSTNIFRIWIPTLDKVISSRDVTFDENKRYDPSYDKDLLPTKVQEVVQLIEFKNDKKEIQQEDIEVPLPQLDNPSATTYEAPQQAEDAQQTEEDQGKGGETMPQMLTPETTPELDDNVVRRRESYLAMINHPEQQQSMLSAFLSAQKITKPRIHRTDLPKPPKSWKEMEKHPYMIGFKAAADKEITALKNRGTFTSIPRTEATTKIIPLMWVFTYKLDSDGYLDKYKARLVARGDLQTRSVYEETYAATLAARIFRVLMALTAYFDLETFQLDAVNAFLNSSNDEDVFVHCAEGYQEEGMCWRVNKAIYGLRKSPLLWFQDITATLKELGLTQVPEAPCLFVSYALIVFFYVDDIVILNHLCYQKEALEFRTNLMKAYEFREIGELLWFLGIRVVRDRDAHKLWLCQDAFIDKIATTYPVEGLINPQTPMTSDQLNLYEGQATKQDIHIYQQKVGSINYAAIVTRPDIARTAQHLSEFLNNPGPLHHQAVDRCINYLKRTKYYALEYGTILGEPLFQSSSDASFADDERTRRSTEGYLFKLFGGSVDWRSTKQKTVTTSTTEAELLALSHAAKQLYWWQRFFTNVTLDLQESYTLHCDNLQTVRLLLMSSPKLVTKLKHVDIHQHWLRQEVEHQRVDIQWIATYDMPADGFTKALPKQKHSQFVNQLGLIDIAHLLN